MIKQILDTPENDRFESKDTRIKLALIGFTRFICIQISWVAYPFLRNRFGEGIFSWLNVIFTASALFWYYGNHPFIYAYLTFAILNGLYVVLRKEFFDYEFYSLHYGDSNIYSLFELVLIGIRKTNIIEQLKKYENNEFYQYLREKLFSPHTFKMIYDPIIFYLIMSFLFDFSYDYISHYIFIAVSIAMALKEYYDIFLNRLYILNHRDKVIEGEAIKEIINQKFDKKLQTPNTQLAYLKNLKETIKGYPVSRAISVNEVIKRKQKAQKEEIESSLEEYNKLKTSQVI